MEGSKLVNVNLGVLGHVDSGKTSLCKALSTTASTAAFDSNPQSQERGITLDLGFSAFALENKWNVTLVDCPGHASLIRTVLGGVQIMDIMLLIIDVNKGMQAQAAECLILANICCPNLIVVLNKVDLLDKSIRSAKIEQLRRRMCATLGKTRFSGEPIVSVSATDEEIGTSALKMAIIEKLEKVKLNRLTQHPFMMAVDHCFSIRGSGTICTGTILQGSIKIGDTIEVPEFQITKKVKSMQVFRTSVIEATAGDRVAIGIPGLDAKIVERTTISTPGYLKNSVRAAIIKISRIQYYNRPIKSRRRYHVTLGYSTVTAYITLFGEDDQSTSFDPSKQYEHLDFLVGEENPAAPLFRKSHYAVLEFDKPIVMLPNALLIGSNLQGKDEKSSRLAFSGTVLDCTQEKTYKFTYLTKLQIFRWHLKVGAVDRIVTETSIIATGFCAKQSNIEHLIGLKVSVLLEKRQGLPVFEKAGKIESRFGKTNKVRITFDEPLLPEEYQLLLAYLRTVVVHLRHKRFVFKPMNVIEGKIFQ